MVMVCSLEVVVIRAPLIFLANKLLNSTKRMCISKRFRRELRRNKAAS